MSEIIDQFYTPLLIEHGFIRDPDNQQYGALGDCWKLSPEVGEGTYWTYGQKDLYDIKIHNFSFHEDFMLECSMPECLSITRYDSISGEELSPYRRLSAGCIKTFIGGYAPYKALIHKNIPIRSVGIEIAPAYYEDYLKKLYPEAQINPVDAFRKIDQTSDFPEMSRLLTEIKDYRGEGIAAKLFYEGKVAEAVSMVVEYQKKHPDKSAHKLSQQDIENLQIVAAYLSDHYAFDIPLERLTQIACMGTTKLKGYCPAQIFLFCPCGWRGQWPRRSASYRRGTAFSCSLRYVGGGYLIVKVRGKLTRCEADKLEFILANHLPL